MGSAPASAPPLHACTLNNGLEVFIQELHTAPLASVWCWYRVGSGDEVPGFTGVSHWVEHMNFKGTLHIPGDQAKRMIESYGGAWNGYTWIDQTAYVETAATEALGEMLFIEAERMAHCLYDPAETEAERTVVISELQGGENDPEQVLETEVTAAAFKAHPYRHPTIGWLPDLERMSRDDLYAHYRRFYVPNNAALVIVGDVDAADVLGEVKKMFGDIPAGRPRPPRPVREPDQAGEHRVLVARPGTTSYLKLVFRAPAANEPDFVPLLLLDAVLAGAKGLNLWSSFRSPPPQRRSRLYRALVEQGLATAVSGLLLPTADPFLYTISCTARAGVALAELEGAALAELDRVRRDGVEEAELERARNQLRARLIFDQDSVTNVAHQIGYFQTIADAGLFRRISEGLSSMPAAAVSEVASRRLLSRGRTVGWFEPQGETAGPPRGRPGANGR
ncbi:MAG: M16 family metallopeptidase [Vicinamibacterales bacterium]